MNLRALFADLLPLAGECQSARAPGESGESGESQASAQVAARFEGGEGLAKSGERKSEPADHSPLFATRSPPGNRAQSKQRQGFSPNSPDSPRVRAGTSSPLPLHDARLPKAEADRCHRRPWGETEIAGFVARVALFLRRGIPAADADDLAEGLVLRDRDRDERRLCLECRHLRRDGGCAMARSGRLAGASRALEPLKTTLQRCESFTPAEGES